MKITCLTLLLALLTCMSSAQTDSRFRPIQKVPPASPTPSVTGQPVRTIQANPAGTAQPGRPIQANPGITDPSAASLAKDYEALYRKEAEKTRELKAQVQSLTQRLAEATKPGGSLVKAYCESSTVSRNTAGARNDCAESGYTCEPVSGLCRTVARNSADCAPGYNYDAGGVCVPATTRPTDD
jgi:hypothetical protein